MAFNNFDHVKIDGTGKLLVQGGTREQLGGGKVPFTPGAQIQITVISADTQLEPTKRCDNLEVTNDELGSWLGEKEKGKHPFKDRDVVYAIGAASIAPDPKLTLWCDKFRIGDDGPMT